MRVECNHLMQSLNSRGPLFPFRRWCSATSARRRMTLSPGCAYRRSCPSSVFYYTTILLTTIPLYYYTIILLYYAVLLYDATIPLYHYATITLYQHVTIPAYHNTTIPAYHYTIIPLYHYTTIYTTTILLHRAVRRSARARAWCVHAHQVKSYRECVKQPTNQSTPMG